MNFALNFDFEIAEIKQKPEHDFLPVRTIEAELKRLANQFKKDTNIAEVETKFKSITEP